MKRKQQRAAEKKDLDRTKQQPTANDTQSSKKQKRLAKSHGGVSATTVKQGNKATHIKPTVKEPSAKHVTSKRGNSDKADAASPSSTSTTSLSKTSKKTIDSESVSTAKNGHCADP